MASTLAAYLRAEIDKRDWNAKQLAERSGISEANVSKLLRGLSKAPELETLDKLAVALDVDLDVLILQCGFTLGRNPVRSREERIADLLAKDPRLLRVADSISQLSEEDLGAIEGYLDAKLGRVPQ